MTQDPFVNQTQVTMIFGYHIECHYIIRPSYCASNASHSISESHLFLNCQRKVCAIQEVIMIHHNTFLSHI